MSGLFAGTSLERPITCERCEKPLAECKCAPQARQKASAIPPKDQPVRVRREKRRGKVVTVVGGLDPGSSDLAAMLKGFKGRLGAGGTVLDDGFEVQGDHRDALVEALKAMGYPAKAAGG